MSKLIVTSILVGSIIIAALIISNKSPGSNSNSSPNTLGSTITTEGDSQIIELTAKGGYSPALINAGADKNTILRVKTINTFDCSAALSIPSLGISKMLPATGTTDIVISPQKSGTQIDGTCSMGMYRFSIKFI